MISYTNYANEKFEILRRHGFMVERASVKQVLELPDSVDTSRKPLVFAERKLDTRYTLRVVFRQEGNASRVVTFYPMRNE